MMVATCQTCRAWYNVDYEDEVVDVHFDMRTGLVCTNNDSNDWTIIEVPRREEWEIAN